VAKSRGPTGNIRICVNCNSCLKRVILEKGFSCPRWSKTAQLRTDLDHMLLTRNYNALWVICDDGDLAAFQAGLPETLPPGLWMPPHHAPAVLFLKTTSGAGVGAAEKAAFADWFHQLSRTWDRPAAPIKTLVPAHTGGAGQTVCTEVENGDFGMLLIGRNPRQPWREHLPYTLRHKVVGLLSPNDHARDVAVLLDFSASSLLISAFVQHAYEDRPDFRLHFIHACGHDDHQARRRWTELKNVTNLPDDTPLKLISARGNVAAAILDEITTHAYGTIIMGKRGLSGIKRLLMGSVSRDVLHRVGQQSLFLVD
jgi:nucleotide-binding universal stress UspA family protein